MLSKKKEKEYKKKQRIILAILIIFLLAFIIDSLAKILLMSFLLILNFLFAFLKKKIPKMRMGKYFLGIEIIMFCTVITSISFGPKIGAIMGSLLMLINYIAERRVSQYTIITLVLYSAIGFSAFYFKHIDIITLGLIITIIYNVLSAIIVSFLGANMKTMFVFGIVNTLFNLFLFSNFGPLVLRILS